jgi:hypothetical protein
MQKPIAVMYRLRLAPRDHLSIEIRQLDAGWLAHLNNARLRPRMGLRQVKRWGVRQCEAGFN